MVYLVFTESSVERPHQGARKTGRWSHFEDPGRRKEHWFQWAALATLAQSCPILCDPQTAACQASLSFTVSWSLLKPLKLMPIELIMSSYHLILCHHFLLLPSIFPRSRVFFRELALCIRWANYWSFSFSISPSNEYSGLISFRINWFDLLAVQGTLKRLLQQHSLKSSTLWHSAFFMVPTKVIQRL